MLALVANSVSGQDVSRVGQAFNGVIMVSAPGVSTPSKSLGLCMDPADEPTRFNELTPLGQRQQYLIGNELGLRYVQEAENFLDENYVVQQFMLQAPFFARGIQSLQAQMIGFYPESTVNTLTEWQQGNAVPPINGADFSEWQQELGANALPYNFNTYPIQQFGLQDDQFLSFSEQNCSKWSADYDADTVNSQAFTQLNTDYP